MQQMDRSRAQPLPSPFDATCFIGKGALSEAECLGLIARIEQPLKIDTTASSDADNVLRVVERTSLQDEELASFLFDRVSPFCPSAWTVSSEDEHLGPFSKGSWRIDSVDARIQLYRYHAPEGLFGRHRDKPTLHSLHKRSLFTVLVYLNNDYKEGQTVVYSEGEDEEEKYCKVPNDGVGDCFVMLQRMLHEGSRVEEGTKYALRCDVLYRREDEKGVEDVGEGEEDEKERAKKWFRLASCLELSGKIEESVGYYRKAYKLDPDLVAE
ncbi:hypothetical protein QOT17_000866 [Balamuthia mandrillaris]